jgi:hypothetical protein
MMTPRNEAARHETNGGSKPREHLARELMQGFAERTGLVGGRPPKRYLWTDAFAVCNFLSLGRSELAMQLIDQVHSTLGRHRADDPRRGWLSGLEPAVAEAHPTVGGLRIGKELPERGTGEPFDDRLEWNRDGQYFHYLTKWMHALDQVAHWTGGPTFNLWARELAVAAHRAFTYTPEQAFAGERRMFWKMSLDLSRPVVASMGHHDPLDGHITCRQLQATAVSLGIANEGPGLDDQAADFAAMIPSALSTQDPLGIGGLLADAWRVQQLTDDGAMDGRALRDRLIDAALAGLSGDPVGGSGTASSRLAFRELGLAIGLAALPLIGATGDGSPQIERRRELVSLRMQIEDFWLRPAHQTTATWVEHQDINEVMLATSLVPSGYLTLSSPAGVR